jgi:NAD(P)H-binding
MTQTVAFFGASTGVGLATLQHSLSAGYQCTALCRTPSKLTSIFPAGTTPNLKIVEGNAHDTSAVSRCLQSEDGKMVDQVVMTIGGKPVLAKMSFDDPDVCKKGMATLLESIVHLRSNGFRGRPYIIVCSTTGISRFGCDLPFVMAPLYQVALKTPHEDKRIMEDRLTASGENFTIVRPSLLTSGESNKKIRVGIEDPKTGRESEAIGYTISREDAGKWFAENLVEKSFAKYLNKIVMITY